MKYIRKKNIYAGTTEVVSIFDSEGVAKLEKMNGKPLPSSMEEPLTMLMKVCGECPKTESDEENVKSILADMCDKNLSFEDKLYFALNAGAGEARKATSTWLDKDIIRDFGTWAMCGLDPLKMNLSINKYMAYIGLLFSASKSFEQVFGKKIDVRRVAIVPDAFVEVESTVDFVEGQNVKHNVRRKIKINALDGLGMIRFEMTNGEACTLRANWMKPFVLPMPFDRFKEKIFIDIWGVEHNIDDVDVILTKSCFKTADLYESWEQYCDAFEEGEHEFRVCVREHRPKPKGLPYQQGQTLMGSEGDAMRFAFYAHDTVRKYELPQKAPELLRGPHRQAATMYPALLTESHTKRVIQEMYTTKRNDMLGGRIPELGYNAFLAPDPVAFVEHVFGHPIKGCLKAGECFCRECEPGLVDVTRSPHLDNAHVLLENVKRCKYAYGPTMYINIWDLTTIQLRADYDGDHVWYSQDEHLIDLVKRTYNQLNNAPIDWNTDKAPKTKITKAAVSEFIINLIHGSEIGLYADALTKMWNSEYDPDVCAWLTYAANVLIDSAKHASAKITIPKKVKELNNVSLPLFAMYAKADTERPLGDYWLKERTVVNRQGEIVTLPPRCAYSGSFLDMYSKFVQEMIPEKLDVLGLENEVFNRLVMMINPERKIGNLVGLSKKGFYNAETGKFEGAGVFQEIAFRHSTEWNKLVGDGSFFLHRAEWEEETSKKARAEIIAWARAQYNGAENFTDQEVEDACYDIIVRNIFTTKMSEGMDTVIKSAFWRIYGAKCVKVLKANMNKSIPELPEDEDFLDVDEDMIDNLD